MVCEESDQVILNLVFILETSLLLEHLKYI